MVLEVNQLRTHFHTRHGVVKAVDGISFSLAEGETLGIVGESGSGKTITGLSLARLIEPPGRIVEGQVILGGQDLLKLDDAEMRRLRGRTIAMVPQDPMTSLNPVLTVGEQLSEGLRLHLKLSGKEARQRAAELLHRVHIPDAARKLDEYPHQFSGGMRQRVMIAMALGCGPRLVIADEATSALDVTIQAQIMELFEELTGNDGTSLIFITHNFGLVARHVDTVMVMYAGHAMETAPARSLFARPQHPYTRALLGAIPRLDVERTEKLASIKGQLPNLAHLPKGCLFRPRCSQAQGICETSPPLREVGPGHQVRCWIDPSD